MLAKDSILQLADDARRLGDVFTKNLQRSTRKSVLRDLHADVCEASGLSFGLEDFADSLAQTVVYSLLCANGFMEVASLSYEEAWRRLPRTGEPLRVVLNTLENNSWDRETASLLEEIGGHIANSLQSCDWSSQHAANRLEIIAAFYEPFLAAYDKKLKYNYGVFFTPKPVVTFMVRAVDDLLREEFGLSAGLADCTLEGDGSHNGSHVEAATILDPAVGTGVFLLEVVEVVHRTMLARWRREKVPAEQIEANWQAYVRRRLLPRLFGMEIMLGSYVAAHSLLAMKLLETGFAFGEDDQLHIFLGNTLETSIEAGDDLLTGSGKHNGGSVHGNASIPVIIGNPPYASLSTNASPEINQALGAYKTLDGKPLNERKHWLHDDYVKFFRFAQVQINRAGAGVLALATNHSYLDNVTFRAMRRSLQNDFARIDVIDLHGNAKKREQPPPGRRDENVFPIQQGAALGFFVRCRDCTPDNSDNPENAHKPRVRYAELWGSRCEKLAWLADHGLAEAPWSTLSPQTPHYFLHPCGKVSNGSRTSEFCLNGRHDMWKLNEIFPVHGTAMVTARDHFVVDEDRDVLLARIAEFRDLTICEDAIRRKYFLGRTRSRKYAPGDTRGWKLSKARVALNSDKIGDDNWRNYCRRCLYRPFDMRWVYYCDEMIDWPRRRIMSHLMAGNNLALISRRQMTGDSGAFFYITNSIISDGVLRSDNKGSETLFPLYLYDSQNQNTESRDRRPNLHPNFVQALSKASGLHFVEEGQGDLEQTMGPEDALHFMYAVFHWPTVRRRFAPQWKFDFPAVPVGIAQHSFRPLAMLGKKLVKLHLLAEMKDRRMITSFPVSGENRVEKIVYKSEYKTGKIYINERQYFGGVSESAWELFIGGRRPTRKWLLDRRGAALSAEQVEHFQQMVEALHGTSGIVQEIEQMGLTRNLA